ncbi:sugar phosphate isomerase/epimerase [Chloroflexia bacterium SDU3-3]|nr:sugar phosphate isomerase/epimerase [Chloroflexia bacterium SDU3-3]
MSEQPINDIYLSFFMFTTDLQPTNRDYTQQIIEHMQALRSFGYAGFDLPIAPPSGAFDPEADLAAYMALRDALDSAGLHDVGVTTNVGATHTYDPSSPYREQRELGLAYLKSRVDITKALRGTIMAGPIVLPYGVFPTSDFGQPIWSDALQDWMAPRYRNAQPIIQELGEYAAAQGVELAIEPVDHWETPGPNMVREVREFLQGVASPHVGVCVDSAHVVLGSDGPDEFVEDIASLLGQGRVGYVHISSPDRGAVRNSWIPWQPFLAPILPDYRGPLLVEVFNAIPAFLSSLRITRRIYQIPGQGPIDPSRPDAYTIAHEAIEATRHQVAIALGQFSEG